MSTDRTLRIIIAGDASGAARAAGEADTALGRLGDKISSAGDKMTVAGRKMTLGVTLPLVGIAAKSVQTAGEFEKTMNTMGAVAGVPADGLKRLSDLAIKMGQDTVFSANEAAQAMLELGKAGISPAEIEAGALAKTLELAAAGDLELAQAATIAANAMKTFSLEGKDAGQIADALAGAANASSANVDDLAMALSQSGNAAASAGLSLQETTAALAAFADNGIKGSDAGTSLKTMLLNLVPTSAMAREAMNEVGLSFVDPKGNIDDLTTVAAKLEEKLGSLTQAEQQYYLKKIFGTDAFRAANIVMKEGADGIQKYIDATSKAGSAQEVADAKMKGWAGTLEKLKGSLETAALAIGQILIPFVTTLAGHLSGLANAFTSLDPSMQSVIVGVAALVAALGPLLTVLGNVAKVFGLLAAHPVIAAIVAIGAAFGAAYTHSEEFRKVVDGVVKWLGDTVGPLVKTFADFFKRVIGNVVDFVKERWPEIKEAIEHVVNVVKALWERFGDNLIRIIKAAWDFIYGIVKAGIDAVRGVIDIVLGLINGDWSRVWEGIKKVASAVWQGIKSIVKLGINAVKEVIGVVLDAIGGLFKAAWSGIKDAAAAVFDWIVDKIEWVADKIAWLGNQLKGLVQTDLQLSPEMQAAIDESQNGLSGGSPDLSMRSFAPSALGSSTKQTVINFNGAIYGQSDFKRAVRDVLAQAVNEQIAA